jgi:hypothetical protein
MSPRRFVVGFLGSFLAALTAVLAFNVVVDPFALAGTGLVPTALEPDRSIKLDLLQHLRSGPQILILGDSRGRQAEPSYVQRLTGRTAFNAAVTGGSAPEGYVCARFAADPFPHQARRYVWFTDNGLASGVVQPQLAQDPRARRYLPDIRFGLGDVKTYLSTDTTKTSWRVFEKCVLSVCHTQIRYHADGSLAKQSLRYLPEQAKSLKKAVRARLASVQAHPETLAQARLDLTDPQRFSYLRRMLAFMNGRGEVPVIVLNPIYPGVFARGEARIPRLPGDAGKTRPAEEALPLRRRRLRGHPQVGRHDVRLVERLARQPPQHASRAALYRRPLRRGSGLRRGRGCCSTATRSCSAFCRRY